MSRSSVFWSSIFPVISLLLTACASAEATRVKAVAQRNLSCHADEMKAAVERETPRVREWVAACDFTYTRVHCSTAGCTQAPPKPPCVGDLQCFSENPVTLKWELVDTRGEEASPR